MKGNAMKKVLIFALTAFIFLCISSLTAYLLGYTNMPDIGCLILAFVIIIISGFISIIFRKTLFIKFFGITLNSISLGFCIRSWSLYRGYDNSLLLMFSVIAICIAVISMKKFLKTWKREYNSLIHRFKERIL